MAHQIGQLTRGTEPRKPHLTRSNSRGRPSFDYFSRGLRIMLDIALGCPALHRDSFFEKGALRHCLPARAEYLLANNSILSSVRFLPGGVFRKITPDTKVCK